MPDKNPGGRKPLPESKRLSEKVFLCCTVDQKVWITEQAIKNHNGSSSAFCHSEVFKEYPK